MFHGGEPIRILKNVVAIAIAGGALWLSYAFCWAPAVCNRIEARLQTLAMTAADSEGYRTAILARAILDGVRECDDRCVPNTNIAMIKAVGERLVGRPADAVRTYQAALRYANRPELYLNLGNTLAQDDRPSEALPALLKAVKAAPGYADDIIDGELKLNVEEIVSERSARLRRGFTDD